MPTTPLRIFGAPGSPYSRKLRAVLRYRRIPHHWKVLRGQGDPDVPKVKVRLMPILVFPGEDGGEDRAAIDTSPLIRELEGRYQGRAVVPADPVMAFLDALIEDYADEWVTKMMFHYRWAIPENCEQFWVEVLADERVTLAEALSDHGYASFAHVTTSRSTSAA